MALRFIDSFDHYTTTQLSAKWTEVNFTPTIDATAGRCGTGALKIGTTPLQSLIKGIPFGSTTGVIGAAFKFTGILGGGAWLFLSFGYLSQLHVSLARNDDGSLAVYRNGAGTTLLGTSAPDLVRMGEWYFLEFKATIDGAVGTATVRVNGVQVLALTGQNTVGGLAAGAALSFIQLTGAASSGASVDDLYVLDSTGGTNADFLGDVRIEYLHPDGPGATQAWDVVGAATHYQAVWDTAGPDDDTTYIHTATAGLVDTETFSNTGLPAGSIYGLQIGLYARKTDSGLRQIAPVVRAGGTDYVGTNKEPSFASYAYLIQLYETNPATAAAWTIADVNAAEFGIKLTT